MIVNRWHEDGGPGLLELARREGLRNLPLSSHDLPVHWRPTHPAVPGGVMLWRNLPRRSYTAEAPDFGTLLDALAWEAGEWLAVEIWRAQRRAGSASGGNCSIAASA